MADSNSSTLPIHLHGTLVEIQVGIRVRHPSGGDQVHLINKPLALTSGGREKRSVGRPRYTVVIAEGPYEGWWGYVDADKVTKPHPLKLLARCVE